MKKNISLLIIATLFVMLTAGNSLAAWGLQLDNADNDNIFDLWFMTDATVSINGYTIAFAYDDTEVNWADGDTYTHNPPSPFMELFGAPYHHASDPDNVVTNLSASCFVGEAVLSNDYLLASFTLDVALDAIADGSPDVYWFADATGFKIIVDTMTYTGAQMLADGQLTLGSGLDFGTPVPIPGAVWLLGSGLLGMIGIRRKKK